MAKFVVSATVNDPSLETDAKFDYSIVDNNNYTIDKYGAVEAKQGYKPQKGDKFTVEVSYRYKSGKISKKRKTFTVTM